MFICIFVLCVCVCLSLHVLSEYCECHVAICILFNSLRICSARCSRRWNMNGTHTQQKKLLLSFRTKLMIISEFSLNLRLPVSALLNWKLLYALKLEQMSILYEIFIDILREIKSMIEESKESWRWKTCNKTTNFFSLSGWNLICESESQHR